MVEGLGKFFLFWFGFSDVFSGVFVNDLVVSD